MWCIYLLFGIAMIVYAATIVLYYGVRYTLRADYNNLSLCGKVFIFNWIEVLCIKIFVCEGKFYFQFNRGDIKVIVGQDDGKKSKKSKKKKNKIKILPLLYYIAEKFPKIYVPMTAIEYGASFEDIKNRALFDGAVGIIGNVLKSLACNKLTIDNYSIKNTCEESAFRGAEIEGLIKFSLIKIFLFILHIIAVKRKFQTAKS